MQISLILMEEIAKLFLIMFMGYALVKTKLLRVQDSKVVSVILVYLVIPCMIVHAFQIDDSPQVRTGLLFAFAAAAAVHVLFLLFTAILRKPCRLSTIEQLTVIYTNAGILVVPLIQALLGQQYVVYSCGFLVVQLVLIWTHCRSKLTADNGIQWKKILWNINVISIFIGAVLFLCHITLPSVIDDTIQMTGDMVGPMGMLLAGMVIADIAMKSAGVELVKILRPDSGTSHSNEVIIIFTGEASAVKTAVTDAREAGMQLLRSLGSEPLSVTKPYITK